MSAPRKTWEEFSSRYCETQDSTPEILLGTLRAQIAQYNPTGFFMGEAQLMDSSWYRQVVILPFGPRNTYKEPPESTFTPRGLASDTSVVIGWIPAEAVPV